MKISLSENYTPLPNQYRLHTSSSKYRAYIGGFGSGKTKAGCREVNALCLRQPGILGVVCRETYPELRDTTMRTFFEEVDPRLYRFVKSENKVIYRPVKGKSSEILFRAIGKNDCQITSFKSLNLGFAYLDEASEMSLDAYNLLTGRLRQIGYSKKLIITSNPSTKRHWLYEKFGNRETLKRSHEYIKAPSTENYHLPPDYIDDLLALYPADWVERYVKGEFGPLTLGKRVYPEYTRKHHSEKGYNGRYSVLRSWDFGLHTPACLVGQIIDGKLHILAEFVGENELIGDFAERVNNICIATYGQAAEYIDMCDPAGNQKSDKSRDSSKSILTSVLNNYVLSKPHMIKDGILVVRTLMKNNLLTINANKCIVLDEGFFGGYHYPKTFVGEGDDPNPVKDGYYDHLQDCLRYMCRNTELWSWLPQPKKQALKSNNTFETWGRIIDNPNRNISIRAHHG